MKDRLIGMMGTLGLALVMSAAMPVTGAFAFGGGGTCGACPTDPLPGGKVTCASGATCTGSNASGNPC